MTASGWGGEDLRRTGGAAKEFDLRTIRIRNRKGVNDMVRKIVLWVLVCSTCLVLAACGNTSDDGGGGNGDPAVTLRLGYPPESGSAEDLAAQAFKEYVESESGGSITVNLFPGGQLGSETEMAEQCQMGTTEMIAVGEIAAVNACPEYATIMRVPYMFDSYDHLDAYLQSEMGDTGKTIMDFCLERNNMRVLGYYDRGSRQLTANIPVYSVADLENLSLRVPDVAIQVTAWKLTGAVPTSIDASELYLSLSQGLVSAQENPVDFCRSYALNEVQSYIMETNHNYGMRWIFINGDIYDSLTDNQKKILDEGAALYVETGNELVRSGEEETWKWLEENGMTIIPAEEIDLDSIKETILGGMDELSEGWDPCCVEICEQTRPAA